MKRALPAWAIALALVCGGLWTWTLGQRQITGTASVLDRFETVMLDLRIHLKGPRKPPPRVAIVAIDDASLARLGGFPVNRRALAGVIDALREQGTKAVAVDILLAGTTTAADDQALAAALASLPTVIAAAGQFERTQQGSKRVPDAANLILPLGLLSNAASVGLVNVASDHGGTPRHIPLLFKTPGGLQTAFALQAAGAQLGAIPVISGEALDVSGRFQRLDQGWHLPLNYYGRAGSIPTISAAAFLDPHHEKPDLSGTLVVLGVTAAAVGDQFSTPFDPILPGVEIHATAIANLLDGSALVRDQQVRAIDTIAAASLVVLGVLAVSFLPFAQATIVFALACIGWLAVTAFAHFEGLWLSGTVPLAASVPVVLGLSVVRQVFDRHQSRQLVKARAALSRFHSPKLAARIADDPDFLATPEDQKAAILFIDLSGYTGFSEATGARKARDVLKEFHTIVVDEAARHDAVVLDFMGDGAMLGFGIAAPSKTDPLRALQCAFSLVGSVSDWISARALAPAIREVRIGVHYGDVVVSRLGHQNQQQIAATGDCVNVASRLLDVAKQNQSALAASQDLIRAADDTSASGVSAPLVKISALRGRTQPLETGLWTSQECKSANTAS
ncbi:adenylate/guanylate cyclase domain-containing protein [Roseibium denhamense]|uniref:Adenylate cyclase n=1 Tax=Roseibium denhamense TaxID=76305 RepID=A0ABY1PI12_9HYPH|nr:adenylate/guanylate cyclase domain-containing protein [Roseibium denhamense]MTI05585.1 adenylate/guanylate cyclase domain-containing protein [Roseibium denhamense]SMP34576.1 adenylate cyclase [Roseibium denhamense]